ncbi:phytoene desaturase [Candidatus Dojkabacteria bacterium]|nr:phytoene desaturase [Candidatus Dojkabacteria bacterium]
MKKIIVIGGGISGLATAALLAKDSNNVTILEKNEMLGGRGRMWKSNGFSFDMGPSWYMMPEVFDEFFAIFGHKVSDFYHLEQLDSHYKVFISNGNSYNITKDINANKSLFERAQQGGGKALEKYLDKSKDTYEIATKNLMYFDYENLTDILKPDVLYKLTQLNLLKTFHKYITRFFKSKDLQKIIEFTTVFLGGSPYNTPAFYNLISHADFNLGIWYPMGGMYEVVKALESLCKELGVTIKTSEPVTKVNIENGIAQTVETTKGHYNTDAVVNTADRQYFETRVLSDKTQRTNWDKAVMSPSAFNIYIGINKRLNGVEHHNLYFNDTWETHFKEVYKNPDWPETPSYYFHVPSKTDPGVAPQGSESIFILVPVAPGLNDSEEIRAAFATKMITHLEKLTGQSISPHIVTQRIFSRRDFTSDYNSFKGSAFGLAHTLFQTALFRPLNKDKRVENVFYAGQYTNPGVGVPTGIISSMIVRKLVANMP